MWKMNLCKCSWELARRRWNGMNEISKFYETTTLFYVISLTTSFQGSTFPSSHCRLPHHRCSCTFSTLINPPPPSYSLASSTWSSLVIEIIKKIICRAFSCRQTNNRFCISLFHQHSLRISSFTKWLCNDLLVWFETIAWWDRSPAIHCVWYVMIRLVDCVIKNHFMCFKNVEWTVESVQSSTSSVVDRRPFWGYWVRDKAAQHSTQPCV